MPTKKSTIYDLAALAGISASTVSAIVNGSWQNRRISEATAQRVLALAAQQKFTVNRQASGLRTRKSGLIGMIIPTYEDRFFGALSQTFTRFAREQRLQPIVASTLRDPALELETVRTMISYRIDSLIITGASAPDAISKACREHRITHVNVDLPGSKAPSVISDNHWGAVQLTSLLLKRAGASQTRGRGKRRELPVLLGGDPADYATQRRMQGFIDTVVPIFGAIEPALQLRTCGYSADAAEAETRAMYAALGGLPSVLFLMSTFTLEGAIRFLRTLPLKELQACTIGAYDWHPYGNFLRVPVHMVCQDVEGLIDAAFKLLGGAPAPRQPVEVRPVLMLGD